MGKTMHLPVGSKRLRKSKSFFGITWHDTKVMINGKDLRWQDLTWNYITWHDTKVMINGKNLKWQDLTWFNMVRNKNDVNWLSRTKSHDQRWGYDPEKRLRLTKSFWAYWKMHCFPHFSPYVWDISSPVLGRMIIYIWRIPLDRRVSPLNTGESQNFLAPIV